MLTSRASKGSKAVHVTGGVSGTHVESDLRAVGFRSCTLWFSFDFLAPKVALAGRVLQSLLVDVQKARNGGARTTKTSTCTLYAPFSSEGCGVGTQSRSPTSLGSPDHAVLFADVRWPTDKLEKQTALGRIP